MIKSLIKLKRILLLVVLLFFLFPVTVCGQTAEEAVPDEQGLLESSGASELMDGLPDGTADFFAQNGISGIDSGEILNLDSQSFMGLIWDGIKSKLTEPLGILATAVGVVLLASLLGTFEEGFEDKSFAKVFRIVSVLCISGIIVTPIVRIIKETVQLIEQVSGFLLGFVPVYAGIISVSGKPLSAFTYNSMLVGVVELVSFTATHLLIPLSGVYLALCLAGASTDQIQIGGISKSIKTVTTWILGLLLTIFVGILTIKSFVANSADSVTLRTGKYLIGSFVPVIGGAISEALNVVQGSVGVIKSTVGAFGILAVLVCFLPGIVSILLMNLAVRAAQGVSDLLEVKKISGLLEAAGFVLSFLQSMLICYGVMVIVSISLMLVLGLNGT